MKSTVDVRSTEFQQAFVKEMINAPQVMIELDGTTALALIGNLQLALRHPGNKGHSAGLVRRIVDDLIESIGTTPTLRAGLEAGNHECFDAPTVPQTRQPQLCEHGFDPFTCHQCS
jgi:hypothetical protein